MPLGQRSSISKPDARGLDLPPPFRAVALREAGDAFVHACAHAAALGAGALVFVGRFDLAEFAVVMEPEEPLVSARLAFYAGMVALHDALAALAPPEKPIAIEWPDAIHVDGGLVGGGRLGWPQGIEETSVPDWLVFGAAIRTTSLSAEGAGLYPLATALEDEGFGEIGSERLVEGFARHLMGALDRWQDAGCAPLAKEYLLKLAAENGLRRHLDAQGDLHLQQAGKALETRKLRLALTVPSWIDPKTGGPRR